MGSQESDTIKHTHCSNNRNCTSAEYQLSSFLYHCIRVIVKTSVDLELAQPEQGLVKQNFGLAWNRSNEAVSTTPALGTFCVQRWRAGLVLPVGGILATALPLDP